MSFVSISLIGIFILLLWIIVNIYKGLRIRKSEPKGTTKYFLWEINLFWNCIIVLISLVYILLILTNRQTISANSEVQLVIANIILAIVFIDIICITSGYYLRRGKKLTSRQQGYGMGLMIQGTFLLALNLMLSQALFVTAL